jgi:hypothetical protein
LFKQEKKKKGLNMEHNTTSSNILVVWWALCGEERWIMINQLMIITVCEREREQTWAVRSPVPVSNIIYSAVLEREKK